VVMMALTCENAHDVRLSSFVKTNLGH